MRLRPILLLAALLLPACSQADLLNATIPREGFRIEKDIAYGKEPRQKLDIYIPSKPKADAPVMVFFYGGSWQMGSKDDYLFVGEAFASRGITTVIADYRLYPDVYFPSFVHDGANAVAWVHAHIKDYGGNPEKMFLAGHSAGAHIAVMLTVNPIYFKQAGAKTEWIKGTMGIAGPYDFLPLTDPPIIALFSKAKPADTQPISFVHGKIAPLFLATGTKDEIVQARNSINLAQKLKESGSPVTLHLYPEVSHIGIVLSLAHGFQGKTPLLDDMMQFMQ